MAAPPRYMLQINKPGSSSPTDLWIQFVSDAPFSPLSAGDVISTEGWRPPMPLPTESPTEPPTEPIKLLRVVSVRHLLFSPEGPVPPEDGLPVRDPIHKMIAFTEERNQP
jgi:hypothetical protein